jgi:lipopolysaccharide export LptBFGC system permease protein LptF
MVVWFSSGRGLTSFVPPVLRFSWPVLLVIAASALWLLPWTHEKTQELRSRYQGQTEPTASAAHVGFDDEQQAHDGARITKPRD